MEGKIAAQGKNGGTSLPTETRKATAAAATTSATTITTTTTRFPRTPVHKRINSWINKGSGATQLRELVLHERSLAVLKSGG